MNKLALGALLAGLAACGGGGNNNNVVIIDAPTDTGPGTCNPLTQTGCAAGEKCANRTLQATPTEITEIACVPDGTKTQGQACTEGPPGAMGYSDCAKGFECVNATCRQICDHQGGQPMCDANNACGRYDGLFESGDMTVAGVCDPKCDPLTQALLTGTNTVACGSPNPAMASVGCFTFDYVDFTCAGIPTAARNLTNRTKAFGPASGGAYVNGCAAGYVPFFREATGSTTTVCAGMCAPRKTDSATAANGEAPTGNPAVAAKLHNAAAPAVGDGICVVDKKGGSPDDAGEQNCHYLWPYNNDGTNFLPSPYNNTLGLCFAYSKYTYNHDNNPNTPNREYPACQDLPPKGTANPGEDGTADEFPCYSSVDAALTTGVQKAPRIHPAVLEFRVGVRSGKAYRHALRQ